MVRGGMVSCGVGSFPAPSLSRQEGVVDQVDLSMISYIGANYGRGGMAWVMGMVKLLIREVVPVSTWSRCTAAGRAHSAIQCARRSWGIHSQRSAVIRILRYHAMMTALAWSWMRSMM